MHIPRQHISRWMHVRHPHLHQRLQESSCRLLDTLLDHKDHFDLCTILVAAFVWAMSDMSSLTISAYFPSYAEREFAVSKSVVGMMFAITAIVELMAMPFVPKVMARVNSPMKVLRLASFALAVVNLLWAFAYKFESYFVTICFVIRAGQGVAMSFVEVASSSVGLRSAGPKRISEALGIIFTIRAAGMLVGPILGGVLFQVGGYPAPGVATSAFTFVTMLLTLKPVSLVEHEHARQAQIGIFELLTVPGICSCLALITSPMIAFSFMGPTLQTHVQGSPFNLDSSGVSMVFSCSTVAYLVSNAVIGPISKRRGEGPTGLVCTVVLGLAFLLLGPAPYLSSVPQRTTVLCVLMVFLGFSVGGITVPVETLMTKLVVCYYHGRGQSIQVSHFSDTLAAMSGFTVTFGAILGPVLGGVLVDVLTFSAGATALGYLVLGTGLVGWIFVREAQFISRVPYRKVIGSRSNLEPSAPSSSL